MLLIAGLRISALSQPPTGFIPKPVIILLPQALPHPLSVLICRPSPLLPYAPSSLLPLSPGLLDPSNGTPYQPHLSFWYPVHHLHWSHHSLSPTVPPPSIICPPDQCKPQDSLSPPHFTIPLPSITPHKSVPSPRFSPCRSPPQINFIPLIQSRALINLSPRPDPASVVGPHGTPH